MNLEHHPDVQRDVNDINPDSAASSPIRPNDVSSSLDDDAAASLLRRERLWSCSQMFGDSPTEVAKRYEQMTGEPIARNVVAKQLGVIGKAVA